MRVGRQSTWRICQNYVCTNLAVRRAGVEHNSILHQIRAIFDAFYLVDHALVGDLCFEQCHLLFCRCPTGSDVMTI
jgi:hypothetical protein